ncbi:pentapeptide repeat-containing protein [Campylobacter lari]|uniref:pentapeptide repeat-containing protein n=1 Tax=Campylobacter lari TaxID=201 RepID=UPI00137F4540|nr:pentapeptide repeat-containing protein [Campylobacter lari]MBT0793789.1 pentapeptide repeat-containing protein [Campylobacter lari]
MQKLLESYGILVQENIKDTNVEINENTITIHNSNISEIDLNILEQKQINKITITNCEIDYIYFANNNIELFFSGCVFRNQIIARRFSFHKKISFIQCIFEKKVDFSGTIFGNQVDFGLTKFEGEARFIETKFLAEYTNQKNIENNFIEAVFKGKVSFARAEFKARVDFSIVRFEGEARFINTSFFKNTIIFSEVEFNNVKFISDKERDKTSTNNTAKQIYHFQDITFKGIVNFENIHIEYLKFKNVIFNNIVVFDDTTLDNKPKFINCTFSNQFNIKHDCIQYDYNELKEKNKNTYDEFLNLRDLFRKLKSNRIAHHNLIDASELRAQGLYARELELTHEENKNLKDTIEQWQLFFYRKLCDHHTDLVLNAKWLATTITVFLCLYFLSKYGLNFQHFINEYNNNSIIKYININFIYKFENYNGFIFIFYTYILIFMLWNVFRIFFSFAVILCCIINQPKLIFGIANLIGDNSYNAFENLLITLYTLIAGLIIFSLQKTARKNTIIPN